MTTDRRAAGARRMSSALMLAAWLMTLDGLCAAQTDGSFSFVYVTRQADPYYDTHKVYTGLILRDHHPSTDGARLAIRESRILARGIGVSFALEETILAPDDEVGAALGKLVGEGGPAVFILDLPAADVRAAGKMLAERDVILFNVRNRDDELRAADCSPVLFHTIPSNAMLMDALAQYLSRKGWSEVLSLVGESEEDGVLSKAFLASARKFRLKVSGERRFVLGNDPRSRDQNNIALLTASASYDVVFLADSVGEFGRYVPYQTRLPRPVVGSAGLESSAWHWTWERYGAPQLNQRFHRIANRRMQAQDWAAWAAVKSVIEAILRAKSADLATLRSTMVSDGFNLDTYKGAPGTFRSWDHQLRQAILLHTHDAVIERAPFEGFLHEKNALDTLGVDARESRCAMR